eukprot:1161255-Pelagomonas_calceolata.AAC.4
MTRDRAIIFVKSLPVTYRKSTKQGSIIVTSKESPTGSTKQGSTRNKQGVINETQQRGLSTVFCACQSTCWKGQQVFGTDVVNYVAYK